MFLSKLKDFFIKKKVKKSLSNVKLFATDSYIKSVALIFDESNFSKKNEFINELINNGIDEKNIHYIVYKDIIKKEENFDYITFSLKDINWNASITEEKIIKFISFPFDLLISYYDIEKAPLLVATKSSKANFKVGFAAIDNRLNHFMIQTQTDDYKLFINELFKYLKILKKI